MSEKSIKLNRDLDRMLNQAIERDLLVRIGWGREGDEKPKNGEIGGLSMLPDKSRSLLLGDLGEGAGMMNRGGTATIQGSVSSLAGAWMSSGRLVIEKDAGSRTGYHMSGGFIIVHGSVESYAGSNMTGGTLLIRGDAGPHVGSGMSGGTIIVMGTVGESPGKRMSGGKIVICGGFPESENITTHLEPPNISEESLEFVTSLGIDLPDHASVFTASADLREDMPPVLNRDVKFTGIGVLGSGGGKVESAVGIETSVELGGRGEQNSNLVLQLPWISIANKGTEGGSSIVTSIPSQDDLLMVDSECLSTLDRGLLSCRGFIVDIEDVCGLNDAELESVVVAIRSRMGYDALVMLCDRVDRVDELSRRCSELDLDGIMVDVRSLDSAGATVALPRIGMANKKYRLSTENRSIILRLDGETDPETLIIARSAGISAVASPGLSESRGIIKSKLEGLLREMGLDSIRHADRGNIRALNHDTAIQTGLRLVGLDRPLSAWTRRD